MLDWGEGVEVSGGVAKCKGLEVGLGSQESGTGPCGRQPGVQGQQAGKAQGVPFTLSVMDIRGRRT